MIAYCGWKVICELKLKKKYEKSKRKREGGFLFVEFLTVPRAFPGCLISNGQERWSVPIGTLRDHWGNGGAAWVGYSWL